MSCFLTTFDGGACALDWAVRVVNVLGMPLDPDPSCRSDALWETLRNESTDEEKEQSIDYYYYGEIV